MKIMSLNTAFGEQEPALREFLASKLGEVAIFCFQESTCEAMKNIIDEVYPADRFDIATTDKYVPASEDGRRRASRYGIHTIVKRPMRIVRATAIFEHEDLDVGQALATEIELKDKSSLTVVNVHGRPLPDPDHKLDTPERIRQSGQIIEWLGCTAAGPVVICGDFNLSPNTKSIKMFSDAGYVDLNAQNNYPCTRNEIAWKQWPDSKQLHADYVFVSKEVACTDFHVPDPYERSPASEASDHLPITVSIDAPDPILRPVGMPR